MKRKSGFTLIEIIIVIIIVGVLASLAMPKFMKTVEYSRALEALATLGMLRHSVERYYIPEKNYTGVTLDKLDVDNPNSETNLSFSYTIVLPIVPNPTSFILEAKRNTSHGGDGTSTITIDKDGKKTGTGAFSNIR